MLASHMITGLNNHPLSYCVYCEAVTFWKVGVLNAFSVDDIFNLKCVYWDRTVFKVTKHLYMYRPHYISTGQYRFGQRGAPNELFW